MASLGGAKRQEQRATKREKNHNKNHHESCDVLSNDLGQGFCVQSCGPTNTGKHWLEKGAYVVSLYSLYRQVRNTEIAKGEIL